MGTHWGRVGCWAPLFISPSDAAPQTKIGAGRLMGPKGVAVDRNGHIIVVDNKACCVFIFQSNGKLVTKFGSRGTSERQFAGTLDGNPRQVPCSYCMPWASAGAQRASALCRPPRGSRAARTPWPSGEGAFLRSLLYRWLGTSGSSWRAGESLPCY